MMGAMARAVLSLMLVVAMLVPNGVCVCQAAACHQPVVGSRASVTNEPTHTCCHSDDCEQTPDDHPSPDRHLPGCPASCESGERASLPAPCPAPLVDAPSVGIVELIDATELSAGCLCDTFVFIPSLPHFLTNCSLLI
jgi:hypothetical protein